jgi:hypothetical protein
LNELIRRFMVFGVFTSESNSCIDPWAPAHKRAKVRTVLLSL